MAGWCNHSVNVITLIWLKVITLKQSHLNIGSEHRPKRGAPISQNLVKNLKLPKKFETSKSFCCIISDLYIFYEKLLSLCFYRGPKKFLARAPKFLKTAMHEKVLLYHHERFWNARKLELSKVHVISPIDGAQSKHVE